MHSSQFQLQNQYLTFRLATETYGVRITDVLEVKAWEGVNALPRTPAYVPGVTTVRGSVVPIVDLRMRLDLEEAEYGHSTVTIILRFVQNNKQSMYGIVVDAVSDVLDVDAGQIKPVPYLGNKDSQTIIDGIADTNGKMVILLSTYEILSQSEMTNLENRINMHHRPEEI